MSDFKLSKSSLDKLDTCHEDLKTLMVEAIKESPYDFGISWGHRTPVKQNELYQKGRSSDGVIVDKSKVVTYVDGYNKKSKHNHLPALAADIMCYVAGNITWEPSAYVAVGTHIMEVSEDLYEKGLIKNLITWGGNWHKFKDWPHFQI